jgi:hypothetical protein
VECLEGVFPAIGFRHWVFSATGLPASRIIGNWAFAKLGSRKPKRHEKLAWSGSPTVASYTAAISYRFYDLMYRIDNEFWLLPCYVVAAVRVVDVLGAE